MWTEWLVDEQGIATDAASQHQVNELYQLAQNDYMCKHIIIYNSSLLTIAMTNLYIRPYVLTAIAVPLWLQQIEWMDSKYDDDIRGKTVKSADGDMEKRLRSVLEAAIVACGTHVTEGTLLWNARRAFELKLLDNLVSIMKYYAFTM
jgi:hypothetical protein